VELLPVYQTAIIEFLAENGIVDVDVQRAEDFQRSDLNGDGVEEVIIAATHRENYADMSAISAGDYSFVILRMLQGDTVITTPLKADFYPVAESNTPRSYNQIFMLTDLDEDGVQEIIVNVFSGTSGLQMYVFEINTGSVQERLVVDCSIERLE
jgi:hypothetical protein